MSTSNRTLELKGRRPILPHPSGVSQTPPANAAAPALPSRRLIVLKRTVYASGGVATVVALMWGVVPWLVLSWNTISTDDAYVEGHVTFVAPRVEGQVTRVLVDDNMRVQRGDVLVEIDAEPFRDQVEIDQALVLVAETDLRVARSQAEAYASQAQKAYFDLRHAVELVRNQVAVVHSRVADMQVEQASLTHAERDLARNLPLAERQVVSQASLDLYLARRDEARSRLASAAQAVQEARAQLGLPPNAADPLEMPTDLVETYSQVRGAAQSLREILTQLGYPGSVASSPQSQQNFERLVADAIGYPRESGAAEQLAHIDQQLLANAPIVKQAEAKLQQAQKNLKLAKLNLSYCRVVSEIDGVVTRRNVNPGNFVQAGQSLMAVRSLREIWINANFKETQLAELRIGQRVELRTDMYGRRRFFEGRITGFTMGTGQTLALLPPQNATGNFIKIVQRLPVRVELTNYDPDEAPLFVGLSVVPYVYFREPAIGPHAGDVLQPPAQLPTSQCNNATTARTQGASS